MPVAGQSGAGVKSSSGFPGLNDRLQLCGVVLQVRSSGLPLNTPWPNGREEGPLPGWGVELYEDCQACLVQEAAQRLGGFVFRACGLCRGTGAYDQARDDPTFARLDLASVRTGDPCLHCRGAKMLPGPASTFQGR